VDKKKSSMSQTGLSQGESQVADEPHESMPEDLMGGDAGGRSELGALTEGVVQAPSLNQDEWQKITNRILQLKVNIVKSAAEIGENLLSVKESISHGAWQDWVEDVLDISPRVAQKLMKIANTLRALSQPERDELRQLDQSKLEILSKLPPDKLSSIAIDGSVTIGEGKVKPLAETTCSELRTVVEEMRGPRKSRRPRSLEQLYAQKKKAEERVKELDFQIIEMEREREIVSSMLSSSG